MVGCLVPCTPVHLLSSSSLVFPRFFHTSADDSDQPRVAIGLQLPVYTLAMFEMLHEGIVAYEED